MTKTDDVQAELARLRAENEALKAEVEKPITFKVGEKGGVSVYGLGWFPVTLYKEQWDRLIEAIPALEDFIAENVHRLKVKGQR